MPEITKLEVQKNNKERANLYIDEKFYAGVSVELCIKHHLKKGIEIDVDELDKLILEDEKESAFTKAIKYISSNLKTTSQIKDYLHKKGYCDNTISYVIDKMTDYKYLDDAAYARAFIHTFSSKYGKTKLISALKSKGITDYVIEDVFAEGVQMQDSIESVANKYMKNKDVTLQALNKLSRFLYSRGYEFDEINKIVDGYRR